MSRSGGEDAAGDVPANIDVDTLLDFSDVPTTDIDVTLGLTAPLEPQGVCPSHPGNDSCLCHGLMGNWDLPAPAELADVEPFLVDEPDYTKFENWIPRFLRPDRPCDYCRSKRLDCYLQRGEASCTPCKSLFRECSLTNSHTLESTNYLDLPVGTFLDTLHPVDENAAKEQGAFTGLRSLRSKEAQNVTNAPSVDDKPGSSKRNGIRFPRHAIKILRDWLDSHSSHPYPTDEERAELERKTDLKTSQVANWLANARRRRKMADRAANRVRMSPSVRPCTPALPIPGAAEKPWEELNPFERWQHSPPEHEPASITDIANAVANHDFLDGEQGSASPSELGRRKKSSDGSGFSNFRAASTTSLDTSAAHSSSLSASSAVLSQGSSHSRGSFGSFNSSLAGKRDRRHRRRPGLSGTRQQTDEKKRVFQCTFCTDTFKSKYDWTRHEKSLHLSLEKWICHPLGPVVVDSTTNDKRCCFCDEQDPSDEHIETHNYRQCEDKGIDARTFYRKDHLRQHLRLMHGCEMTAFMENWKSTAININSRCGFCAQRFTVWQERVDHLTAHFKAGARMSEWKGCRGLDPAVAAQVTNAMPPYLIGIETVSPDPFSATDRSTLRQVFGDEIAAEDTGIAFAERNGRISDPSVPDMALASKATCWEILTVRLGKHANEMAQKGLVLSDEMLQRQARRILYDSDDAWNQTAADNPEWLDLFKKAHGLDFIPSTIGGQGTRVPEDLETYQDLGLRVPFAVQLQANNSRQTLEQSKTSNQELGQQGIEMRRAQFDETYQMLEKQGRLHAEDFNCGHEECKHNALNVGWLNGDDGLSRYKRWCNHEVPTAFFKPTRALAGAVEENETFETSHAGLGFAVPNEFDQFESVTSAAMITDVDGSASRKPVREDKGQAHTDHCLLHMGDRYADDPSAHSHLDSFEALIQVDAPGIDPQTSSEAPAFVHQQRHKLTPPPARASHFSTFTGPWIDSGAIPQNTLTATTTAVRSGTATTTGAMMEFLGSAMGEHLPFSTDALTSSISLPAVVGESDWMTSANHVPPLGDLDVEALYDLRDLEPSIADATTAETLHGTLSAAPFATCGRETLARHPHPALQVPTASAPPGPDTTMLEDYSFEDVTFPVFDLDLDDVWLSYTGA